jgi:AraC-like DNA-binding protein
MLLGRLPAHHVALPGHYSLREVPAYMRSTATTSSSARTAPVGLVERTIDFVDQNYAKPISLRDVAEAVGYSACHLTTTFRQATGLPVTAWIIKRRVMEAGRLLASGTVSVALAGESVGFHDPCYFTRQFVRHIGTTPGRFRASLHGPEGSHDFIHPRLEGRERSCFLQER